MCGEIVIEIDEPGIGSLRWQLPEGLRDLLQSMPPEVRENNVEELKRFVRKYLLNILAATSLGAQAPYVFNTMEAEQEKTGRMLTSLVMHKYGVEQSRP